MQQITKSRLQTIVDSINDAKFVVDVGSDHSYVGIELLKLNKIKHIINIDINQQPLDSGICNLKKHNLLNKSTNILNNGLLNLNFKFNVDFCIIAGMGASSIIEILKNNKNDFKQYILQANTHVYKLREFLYLNGYEIIDEKVVFENGIYYEIIWTKYNNIIKKVPKKYYYITNIFANRNSQLYLDFIKKRFSYLKSLDQTKISANLLEEYNIVKEFLNEK